MSGSRSAASELERHLTRREALLHGVGGVAFVCSFDKLVKPNIRPSGKPSPARRSPAASVFEPFRSVLPIPPVAQPETGGAVPRYEFTMQAGAVEILDGLETPVLGYDGMFPGPSIRARRGDPIEVLQRNQSGRDLNVHLHGGITAPDSDGHPDDFIPTGQERLYQYANRGRAATLWYHDHAHGQTAQTLYGGLAAFYLLSDERERSLDLPRGEYDVPLMIQDRSFNEDGSFRYVPNLDFGFYGDTILVNGALAPRMLVKRGLYRLRLLNASNARPYHLRLGNGRAMIQIAGDVGLLPRPVRRKSIQLQPAERVEILVDFSEYRPGTKLVLQNTLGQGSTVAVMRFDVRKARGDGGFRVPKRLQSLGGDLPEPVAERVFDLDITGVPTPRWEINGMGFDPSRIDATPQFGTTETWTFANQSERIHPMHLHGYHFRIVSLGGKPPHDGDRGWKDTVGVLPGQTVKVRPYFIEFPGRYVFHCHAAEHGDHDMFSQMEVEGA